MRNNYKLKPQYKLKVEKPATPPDKYPLTNTRLAKESMARKMS